MAKFLPDVVDCRTERSSGTVLFMPPAEVHDAGLMYDRILRLQLFQIVDDRALRPIQDEFARPYVHGLEIEIVVSLLREGVSFGLQYHPSSLLTPNRVAGMNELFEQIGASANPRHGEEVGAYCARMCRKLGAQGLLFEGGEWANVWSAERQQPLVLVSDREIPKRIHCAVDRTYAKHKRRKADRIRQAANYARSREIADRAEQEEQAQTQPEADA